MKRWQRRLVSGKLDPRDWKIARTGMVALAILAFLYPYSNWFAVLALVGVLYGLEIVLPVLFLGLFSMQRVEPVSAIMVLLTSGAVVRLLRMGYRHQRNLAKDRQELLKTLVHELRNPLFAAKGTIDILKARLKDYSIEELELQLTMASDALQTINEEVDDLTQLLRLESGRLVAQLTCCRLERIYGNLKRRHPVEASPEHELVFHGAELEVNCDPLLLTQALDKLVSNALLHTAGGKVTVTGYSVFNGTILEVNDDGPGIPEAERKWVFERHKPANRSSGAFGIGLYLAREYILAQDGELVLLDSEKGCLFQISLLPKKT